MELLMQGGGTCLIRPGAIAACIPIWDDEEIWTHTIVRLGGGHSVNVLASLEEILDAMEKGERAKP